MTIQNQYSSITISCTICEETILTVTRRDAETPLTDDDIQMYLQNSSCETDGQMGLTSSSTFRMQNG